MSEIGSGSGSSYPSALDTNTTLEVNSPNASKTKVRAEVPNDLAACIVSIETELGTDPAGTLTDVKTFLQTEHATDGTHGTITTNTVNEGTATSGVTVDGCLIKDGVAALSKELSFEATLSADQTGITTATATKITFDTETFDTNSDYDAATNYRFTPTVAGKYLLSLNVYGGGTSMSATEWIGIYKNGTLYRAKEVSSAIGLVNVYTSFLSIIVDANGSTDYFEAYVYLQGSSLSVKKFSNDAATVGSFFAGCRVGT